MAKKDSEVAQFVASSFSERGGGQRVMHALYKSFGATVYTFAQRVKGEELEEIGSDADRIVGMKAVPK